MKFNQEQFLSLVNDFLGEVNVANKLLKKYLNIENPMYWRRERIPQVGVLGIDPNSKYAFHGIGVCVEHEGKTIDFDYGYEGRIDGFNGWILSQFSQNDKYKIRFSDYVDHMKMREQLSKAEELGLVCQRFRSNQDDLYYLTDVFL